MASNFKKKSSIKDTEKSGFGEYKEYNGGGSPKGGGWGGQDGRVGWKKRVANGEVKGGEHRQNQPRTDDGKFTYNSVNGKETKYESRGETVNPLLTGGVNGIKIDEVEKQFKAKSGDLYDKYKDKWYQRGSKMITKEGKKLKTVIAKDAIWDLARVSFDIKKGEFTGEGKVWEKAKVGARSMEEKAARKQAHTAQEETFVKDPATGGIATHAKTANSGAAKPSTGIAFNTPFMKLAANRAAKKALATKMTKSQVMQAVQPSSSFVSAAAPQQPKPAQPAKPALNHTPQEFAQLRQSLIAKGADANKVNKATDAMLDALWDKLVVKQ